MVRLGNFLGPRNYNNFMLVSRIQWKKQGFYD